jgi:hypothetical protein
MGQLRGCAESWTLKPLCLSHGANDNPIHKENLGNESILDAHGIRGLSTTRHVRFMKLQNQRSLHGHLVQIGLEPETAAPSGTRTGADATSTCAPATIAPLAVAATDAGV